MRSTLMYAAAALGLTMGGPMAAAQDTKPCQRAVLASDVPHRRPATTPPISEATMPETVHQIPAVIENPLALGFSATLAAVTLDMPMPMPSMLSSTWITSAATTPAITAPQETRLRKNVRCSSDGHACDDEP